MKPGEVRPGEIQRFTYAERVVHWVVGLSFLFLLLTGLYMFAQPYAKRFGARTVAQTRIS